ncbi:CDP-glycerol glycerophosphotransferase family protein [Veillonella intestinalis]|uniref:CDP-glycerol glycerophosphotransferase family protein n=1 Tax=Veillonella intestinalis TaxID=2941341 RepID=UPI00203AD456|nr:CDP-glycerol glycerophosphotransferase family protein [Veillonella intestinalis]
MIKEVKLLKEYLIYHGEAGKKAAVARCLYHIIKPFFRKEIWLISDRINKADDNGEALFKFINENSKPVNAYFVLHKDSLDFDSVSQIGKVLQYRSWKHKLYHLLADKWISAAGDDFVSNPFFGIEQFYRDILMKKKQVFLQHGIIKDDLSGWLNRYAKNLDIFVTSALPEYNSIVNGKYFYNQSVVKLTGLARYDRLLDKAENIITIMPTWRSSLVDKNTNASDVIDGVKRYSENFKESDFFIFYNSLINDARLIDIAKKLKYKIRFMPHPNLIAYIDWFKKNSYVEFCSINTKYRDIFSTSSLILTDYSSVAFDFAYLRKPVVYTQFDKETFFSGQVYDQGYFDYERDGFGEVEYTLDDTVNRLIEYMEANCVLKDKYKKRIDSFFAYNDRNNCERIYNEIINLRD